jgi:methylaspartate ammonia-lyase
MTIVDVLAVPVATGAYVIDLAAVKAGAVVVDGGFRFGTPVTPGFHAVREPGEAVSILLVLDDGLVAQGDGMSVVYAAQAGRDPVFRAAHAVALLPELRRILVGQRVDSFRGVAATVDGALGEIGAHSGIRYAASQALLHAAALTARITLAEVICREYGLERPVRGPRIYAQSGLDRYSTVDRMIMRKVPIIPHADFARPADLGPGGAGLATYVAWLRERVDRFAAPDYRPAFHIDLYGSLDAVCGGDLGAIAAALLAAEAAAGPHEFAVEAPIAAPSRTELIDRLSVLARRLRAAGSRLLLVADEHANTLDDVRAFAASGAVDMVQVKAPDMGSLASTIAAVAELRAAGLRAFLGGSLNETDWSARVSTQVAIATGADRVFAKPGGGVDEGYMIVHNEIQRTLALIARAAQST